MPQTKFSGWVTNFGVDNLARSTCCSRFAVYKWLRGESIPRIDRIAVLADLSAGALSVSDVIDHFAACRANGVTTR